MWRSPIDKHGTTIWTSEVGKDKKWGKLQLHQTGLQQHHQFFESPSNGKVGVAFWDCQIRYHRD